MQRGARDGKSFTEGTCGGQFHPDFQPQPEDIVALENWGSSVFVNTDLDYQLKQPGVRELVVIGLKTNTCIESTIRNACELGFEVTLVKDDTDSFNWDEMRAAIEVNLPFYVNAIVSAQKMTDTLADLEQPEAA